MFLIGFSGYLGGVFSRHLSEMPEVEHIPGIDIVEPVHPLPKPGTPRRGNDRQLR